MRLIELSIVVCERIGFDHWVRRYGGLKVSPDDVMTDNSPNPFSRLFSSSDCIEQVDFL